MKEIHLIPDDESDEEHTTAACFCRPINIELKPGSWFRQIERIVFHREVGGKK